MSSPAQVAPKFPDSIFRAYDIRGTVPEFLNAETAYWLGRAIGSQSLAEDEPNVSVGRDGRLSGPELVEQLIKGLVDSGCHVSDVGLVPTPALYYAANVLAGKSGVMLTGSHNPSNYNGFKIVIAGDTLANEQIQALHDRLKTNNLSSGKGSVTQVDILDRYNTEIVQDIKLARRLKVVVDCGNGAAGVIAPQLIEALNCEVIPLFCEVDGNFPNHHPDPGKPENLVDLIAKVRETNADIGLAFDGDGDRVGVVTNTGSIVYPDRLLMLFARDVLARNTDARDHLRRQMHPPPDTTDQGIRRSPADVEDRSFADQKENETNRRAVGRRNERAYLLQGTLVRFRRRHLQRRAAAGNPQQGKILDAKSCSRPSRTIFLRRKSISM